MLGRWIVAGLVVACSSARPQLDAQLPRPLIPLPDEGQQGRAVLRRLVRESGRHDQLFVRLLQSEQATGGDPARAGQLHHAEGVRRPATDILPDRRARARRTAAVRRRGCGGAARRSPAAAAAARAPGAGGGTVRPRARPRDGASSPSRCRPASRAMSSGRCATRARPCPFRDGRSPRRTNSAGRWRWGRLRRCSASSRSGPAGRGPTGIQGPPLQAKVGAPRRIDDLADRRRRARKGADQVRA